MTKLQIEVGSKVIAHYHATRGWYRAAGSGERVTLASLYRAGALERQVWRGIEGKADAAHEYRPTPALLAEVGREIVLKVGAP